MLKMMFMAPYTLSRFGSLFLTLNVRIRLAHCHQDCYFEPIKIRLAKLSRDVRSIKDQSYSHSKDKSSETQKGEGELTPVNLTSKWVYRKGTIECINSIRPATGLAAKDTET